MFRTVPLSIISSFSLYTHQWYMSYRGADKSSAISHCCRGDLVERTNFLIVF